MSMKMYYAYDRHERSYTFTIVDTENKQVVHEEKVKGAFHSKDVWMTYSRLYQEYQV